MYTELMEKMIWELKGEPPPPEEIRAEIHLGIPAFISEDYMPDERMRLLMYKRISMAKEQADIEEIRRELMDCYAFCPPELENLLQTITLRHMLEILKSRKMTCDAHFLCIHLSPDTPLALEEIILLSQKKLKGTKLTPDGKLYIPRDNLQNNDPLRFAENVLKILWSRLNTAHKN
jgi:transcription-repair coupling factor (superfamily II helicase)